MADGYITDADILSDGTHPSDEGYLKMAAVWLQAFGEFNTTDWLQAPSTNVSFSDDATSGVCDKTYGSGADDPRAGTEMLKAQSAAIVDDGIYVHSSQAMGVIAEGELAQNQSIWFAQLVNLGNVDRSAALDELVYTDADGDVWMRVNLGGGAFDSPVQIDVDDSCEAEG
jgi:hypothetical protein